MIIKFAVVIDPIAKGRPRFVRRGRFVHTFTPQKTRCFESELLEKARKFAPIRPFFGNVDAKITFYMPIPESRARSIGDCTDIPHIVKPDVDNLLKSAVDPLNGVFWKDDAQISSIVVRKVYDLNPRIEYELKGFVPEQ